jgi:putative ABC transport system ATP-binding protein
MTGPVIQARGVVKTLGSGAGTVQALRGVDLALGAGELALLMGPSGSGKTTLLSILGCMLKPSAGAVTVGGQATDGLGPEELARLRRAHIGFVFQSYHLFPTLTAVENVRLALDVRGLAGRAARAKARAALAEVGLSHKERSFPRNLSGGEQQRVAIARAIVGDPSAILADEPTAALDGENGQAVMTILARLAKSQRRGVLVVTHDTRLLPFADRIIHIEDGRIQPEQRAPRAPAGPALSANSA